MWPLTSCHLCGSATTYSWSSPLMFLADWMWALSMTGTVRTAAACAPERFLIVSDTHICARSVHSRCWLGVQRHVYIIDVDDVRHAHALPSYPLGKRPHVHPLAVTHCSQHHVGNGGMGHGVTVGLHKGTVGSSALCTTSSLKHCALLCPGNRGRAVLAQAAGSLTQHDGSPLHAGSASLPSCRSADVMPRHQGH